MDGPSTSVGGTTPSSTTVRVRSGIPARVVLRDPRAVGAAVEVDLLRSRAPRVPRRGRVRRCWSCRTAAGRGARRGIARERGAVLRAGSRRSRARRPACRSRGGWSRRCRAGPPARGRARVARPRRPKRAARSPRSALSRPARDQQQRVRLRAGRDGGHHGDGELDAAGRRRPAGSSGTENLPQRASVEVSPSRSAMRQGSSGIWGFASSGDGPSSAPSTKAAISSAREWLRSAHGDACSGPQVVSRPRRCITKGDSPL